MGDEQVGSGESEAKGRLPRNCRSNRLRGRTERVEEGNRRTHGPNAGTGAHTRGKDESSCRCRTTRRAGRGASGGVADRETRTANSEAEAMNLRTAIREREELASAHQELGAMDAKLVEHERRRNAAREALLQKAELDRYRATEEERKRWEEREARLYRRLETVEEELRSRRGAAVYSENNERLRAEQLEEANSQVGSLRQTNLELTRKLQRETPDHTEEPLPLEEGDHTTRGPQQWSREEQTRDDCGRAGTNPLVDTGVGGDTRSRPRISFGDETRKLRIDCGGEEIRARGVGETPQPTACASFDSGPAFGRSRVRIANRVSGEGSVVGEGAAAEWVQTPGRRGVTDWEMAGTAA